MAAPPTPALSRTGRAGSIGAAVRLIDHLGHAHRDPVAKKRRLVAEFCRILGDHLEGGGAVRRDSSPPGGWPMTSGTDVTLSRRMHQTLERLLAGDSEKQIAARLGLSRHTVHVYVRPCTAGST